MANRTTGRPLGFDREEILDQLVMLFWRHGYSATTQADICKATGLSTSSLYNTFGSKAELFDAVLNRYVTQSAILSEPLHQGDGLDGLHRWAGRVRKAVTSTETPRGCLMVMAINELAEEPVEIDAQFKLWRSGLQNALRGAITNAEQQGAITPGDADVRAALLYAANFGLLTAARSNSSRDVALITKGIHQTIDSWAT